MKATLKVNGIMCAHCENSVKKALAALGVTDVSVDLNAKTVTFEHINIPLDKIKSEIEDLGYDIVR